MNQPTSTPLPPPPPVPPATPETLNAAPAIPATPATPAAPPVDPAAGVPAPLTWESMVATPSSSVAPTPRTPLVPATAHVDAVPPPHPATPDQRAAVVREQPEPVSTIQSSHASTAFAAPPAKPAVATPAPPPPPAAPPAPLSPASTPPPSAPQTEPPVAALAAGAAAVMAASPTHAEPAFVASSAPVVTESSPPDTSAATDPDSTPGGRRNMLVTALAVVVVGAVGFLGYNAIGGSDDADPNGADADDAAVVRETDDEADSGDEAIADDDAISDEPVTDVVVEPVDPDTDEVDSAPADDANQSTDEVAADQADASTDDDAPSNDADTQPEPVVDAPAEETTSEDEPADEPADPVATADPDGEVTPAGDVLESKGIVRNGQIFLEGAVPNAEAGQEIEALAAQILGPDNVFNNYVIDPRAGDPNLGNITVEDTINFQTNSAVILPESEGLLNQGLALMTIRPAMTITVVGHTDDRGSDESNILLSVARAESVKQWLVDRGIAPERLTAKGAGESEPIASNDTAEGQRLNRRIQFYLENILGEA